MPDAGPVLGGQKVTAASQGNVFILYVPGRREAEPISGRDDHIRFFVISSQEQAGA